MNSRIMVKVVLGDKPMLLVSLFNYRNDSIFQQNKWLGNYKGVRFMQMYACIFIKQAFGNAGEAMKCT